MEILESGEAIFFSTYNPLYFYYESLVKNIESEGDWVGKTTLTIATL